MVDLKKEIKLSDLVPKRKSKPGGAKLEEHRFAESAPSGSSSASR